MIDISSKYNLRISKSLSNLKNSTVLTEFFNVISLIYHYGKINRAKKLLKVKVLIFIHNINVLLYSLVVKKQISKVRYGIRYKNKSNASNRRNSQLRYDLYNLKRISFLLKEKLSLWEERSLEKKMIVNRYSKCKSKNDPCKISCTHKSRKCSEIKSKILTSLTLNNKSHKTNRYLKDSTFIHSSEQNNQERYTDILREVKKILNEDVISKRKLKYIFKKQKIYLPIYNFKVHSSSLHQKKQRKEFCTKTVKSDKLNCYNNLNLTERNEISRPNVDQSSSILRMKTLEKKLLYEKLKPSSLVSQFRAHSDSISRTPSPALPLIRDESMLRKSTDSTKELPFIQTMNLSENISNFSFKLCNNMGFADYSKRFSIKKQVLSISRPSQPSNSMDNTLLHLCKEAKDILYSNDIKLDKQCSVYQLPSDSHSRTSDQSATPLKISSLNHWSPIILMQNNRSNLSLKVENSVLKSNKETLIYTTQSTSPKTSSILKLSRSESSNFNKCLKRYSTKSKRRSRSLSLTKYSRSSSRSLSNTSFTYKRSCSKESTHTLLSSLNHSRSSHYFTSGSSSASYRTSRQTSFDSSSSRSPSIPRRYGSPSFLDRRRITSARKRPVPYHRSTPSPLTSSSSIESTNSYKDWSQRSHRLSHTPSCGSLHLIS